jgi:hypothetical protein
LTAELLESARRFALDPPKSVKSVPEGWGPRCEVDIDGDGDLDVLVASLGHSLMPLAWWAFLRDGEGYKPVPGGRPHPAYCVTALAVDDDGVLIMSGDGEPPYRVTWSGAGE